MDVKPSDDDEARVIRWIGISITTFYLALTWLIIWLLAHLTVVLLASVVLHWPGIPVRLLIVVEVLPASMFSLDLLRVSIAVPRTTAAIKAVGDARGAGRPRPAWTKQGRLIQRLLTPSDIDLAAAIALVIALEVWVV
jgi:hypothetical protein